MKPREGLFFVRKYTKPEKIGSILVNPAWRTDNSRSLWEVLEEHENEVLGLTLKPDWIVVTAPNRGVFVHHDEGEEVFALSKAEVARVIPWTTEEPLALAPDRVLVSPIEEEHEIIRVTKDTTRRGKVLGAGRDVVEVDEGDEVCYTMYAGVEVEVEGETLLLMREEEILCLLER